MEGIKIKVCFVVKKTTDERKRNDECVREIASELKRDRLKLEANVVGGEKSSIIGEFTPEIEARKDSLSRICEVLTEKDFEDKLRYIEFRNYCAEYDFGFYVVDKDGKRRKIDPETFGKNPQAAEK